VTRLVAEKTDLNFPSKETDMAQSQSPASKSNPTNGNSAEPGLAELQNQIEILKNDIQGLSRTLGEVGRAETYRLAEAAKAKGAAVKSASEEQLEHLRATAEGYGRDASTFVREQPGTALGFAAGFGFLIGFLMRNRK
jgi:ElaB/YqjD/DUF883 family membrane-anchored ribosome-binding protein